jgi:hypothetical protein
MPNNQVDDEVSDEIDSLDDASVAPADHFNEP